MALARDANHDKDTYAIARGLGAQPPLSIKNVGLNMECVLPAGRSPRAPRSGRSPLAQTLAAVSALLPRGMCVTVPKRPRTESLSHATKCVSA